MSDQAIRYVKREEIDIVKWDRCIDKAENGLVYGYSFYLDHLARRWDALVLGDYECIMPLTGNKKYGLHYLYQPPFTPSSGVFGSNLNEEMVMRFIHAIPSKYGLIDISLNHGNIVPSSSLLSSIRTNYILPLHSSYNVLYNNYRENIKRNIKKAQQVGARYDKELSVSLIIQLAKQQMQSIWKLKDSDYSQFELLYETLKKKAMATACGVWLGDRLVSSAVYFFSHKRVYYILVGNHPNGKTIGASHYLIDRFIFDHSGKDLIFDFEGSDIRNVAFFYSSFGATVETYPALYINRLPWYVKWFKRQRV